MRFIVVYEFDIPATESVARYVPQTRSLHLTERTDGAPSEWDSDLWGGKCKHRKYFGELSREQFDKLINRTGVTADSIETGGILSPLGFLPAISFGASLNDCIISMYVCPIPSVAPPRSAEQSERNWQRVRKAILSVYGDGQ